jgi:hypothetical protein
MRVPRRRPHASTWLEQFDRVDNARASDREAKRIEGSQFVDVINVVTSLTLLSSAYGLSVIVRGLQGEGGELTTFVVAFKLKISFQRVVVDC